ncbi:hypothetical protein [Mucilaginibacter sp.]
MKLYSKLFCMIFIVTSIIYGCKKDGAKTATTDIYVAGTANNKATLWKNGVATQLAGLNSTAIKIAVNGNDLYVSGSVSDTGYTYNSYCAYWKNGVITKLNEGSGYGVAVNGHDVYVTGYIINNSGQSIAACWKNGALSTFGQGYVYGITISGNDVYMAGVTTGPNGAAIATYWKNNIPVTFGYGIAVDIAVQGSDIYVAGSYNDTSGYWKNNVFVPVSGFLAGLNSISVSGNNVYLTGSELVSGIQYATYWKNGIATVLTNGFAIYQIAFSGNDIYLVGYSWTGAESLHGDLLWKNNTLTTLASGSGGAYYAQGIAIVNH